MPGVAQLVVATLLATLLGLCAAQSCEAFGGQPTYCADRINYPVYIPFGGTQADLVASLVNLTSVYTTLQTVAPECAVASADMLCSTAFRRCNVSDPLVIPVCDIACTNYNQACRDIGAPREDCVGTQDRLSPGNPLYVSPSVEACTFANLTAGPGEIICLYPFVLNPLIDECVIKCPPPGLDDHTYGRIYQVSALVLSSMSLVCLGLLLATGIATWDQRRAHAYYHIAALLVQLIGVWIGRWLPYEEWACTAPWQGRDQSSTAGALQAGLLMYGTQSAALWNLVLVYTLLNRITENRYQIFGPGRYIPINPEIVYGFVGWLIWPVPFTIAMFAGNWAKSAGWMVLPDAQAGAGWIFIALYIIPVNFLAVIQFALMGFLFYFIGRHAGMRGIQSQIRLLLLCCHYGFRVLYGIIYSYVQFGNRYKIEKRITEWVQCQLNPLGPGCPKPDLGYIGGGAGVVASVLVTSAGIIILLIFLDLSMLKVWWRWARCRGFTEKNSSISTALPEEQSGSISR